MSQNDFIPITEDGGVLKKIITPSTSEEVPQNDQKVEGHQSLKIIDKNFSKIFALKHSKDF